MKNIFSWTYFGILLSAVVSSHSAEAHTRWKLGSTISAPRSSDSGLKVAPCGDKPKSSEVKNYTGGQLITLEFEETINHPGRFEVYLLDANDKPVSGVPSPLAKLEDMQNDPIQNGVYHQYKIQFRVPAVDCPQCAFQLIQVMTENPNAPSNYYSCTDISIKVTAPAKPTGLKIEKRR